MLGLVLLVFVTSALGGDLPMASTPIPPMASPFAFFNPKQQQFVSGSTPFIPNLTSNFSSSASSGPGASFAGAPVAAGFGSASSGPGASPVPPGYGIQQVFYPPAIFYPGMGGTHGSFPNFASNLPSAAMNQNQPSLLGLQGHASPVHQVPWYPTPASTCQGCNLIYRGLPYPGLVPNVQLPSNVQLLPNVQLPPNVLYVRNVPLEPLSQPLVNNWTPHNVQPLPNLYSPEPVPSPVPVSSDSVPLVPEPSSVVPVPESPVVESLSPKEAVPETVPEAVSEAVPKDVSSSSRQKRAVFRSYSSYGYGLGSYGYGLGSYGYRLGSYGFGSWPYYGYRSYLGGWPYYGHRSYYPYRSWGSWYPYW